MTITNDAIAKVFENRNEMIRKAKPIVDPFVSETLSEVRIVNDSSDQPIVSDQESFKNLYHKWILSSNNFYITGLDNFTDRFVTNGVTESFNDFYYINKSVSVLKGEYTYHRDLGINVVDDVYKIPSYTALIISYPFSATGNPHEAWEHIMTVCNERAIKVFVDCCLFGISKTKTLNLNYECITHVAFSMSKTFSTGGLRTGILYTRDKSITPLRIQNNHMYVQHAGILYHTELMKKFSPDYIYNKYRSIQIEKCKEFGISPSDTVIFGISDNDKFSHYERDIVNRMCLTYSLQSFKKDIVV